MLTTTDPKRIFNDILILKFPDIYKMYSSQIGKFMHFYEIGLLSSVFKEMFLMANQVHSYITRNSNNLYIISCPNKYDFLV